MSDLKHQVVITETGEMVAADDPALALELGAPVEQEPLASPDAGGAPGAHGRGAPEVPVEPEERVGRGAAGDAPASAAGQEPTTPAPPPRPAELVPYEPPLDPAHMSLSDIGKLGRVFATSGFFKDSRDAAQAIVKIMAGQELGIGPFQSCAGFHVIEGKLSMSAGLVGALVKRSGRYDFRVQEATEERCVLEWMENGEIVGQSSFSIADAKRAKIYRENSGWTKFPSDMTFARALTQGARRYCPDIFGGSVYAEGEIGG